MLSVTFFKKRRASLLLLTSSSLSMRQFLPGSSTHSLGQTPLLILRKIVTGVLLAKLVCG